MGGPANLMIFSFSSSKSGSTRPGPSWVSQSWSARLGSSAVLCWAKKWDLACFVAVMDFKVWHDKVPSQQAQ